MCEGTTKCRKGVRATLLVYVCEPHADMPLSQHTLIADRTINPSTTARIKSTRPLEADTILVDYSKVGDQRMTVAQYRSKGAAKTLPGVKNQSRTISMNV